MISNILICGLVMNLFKPVNNLVLILLVLLVLICGLFTFFLLRLRKINRNLAERNDELKGQKDLITRKHTESDKFYEMLVQSATDGISFYDRSWNLRFSNAAFYSMIGYDRNSYNTLKQQELIHPDDRQYTIRREQSLASKGFFEAELRLRHKDGHYIFLSARSVLVRSETGEVLGALTISRDITRLKEVYEDLAKANLGAESGKRLKSTFLANVSHEIRTPLNSVVGFANLLLSDDLSDESRAEYIDQINHNSEKLLQIIGDIIDLSRLESSQIQITYEEASLNKIVNEIIEEARLILKRNERSIILDVKNNFEDNGDMIFTDRIWLKRVLSHLMDNAIKFTLEGSVKLIYTLEKQKIVFKIQDTGIGINKENLDRIFEEFSQEIDGHHRPFEGLGIGLTLAKEVIERMGGQIFVESEKGVGSVFTFTIPYRPAGSSKNKIASLYNQNSFVSVNWSLKKCLLVDDNKDVLIYLKRILIDTGVSILTARSGFEALELVKTNPDIDVILLDMQMAEMNGIETTKEIRKIRREIPIIAQTAFVFENDKDIILEAGCDACLVKPIRREHLLTVMSGFVKSN